MKKRFLVLAMVVSLCVVSLCACGGNSSESSSGKYKLTLAYQYGMSYAPVMVMQDQKLIEKYCGDKVEVNWQLMNSGSAINEGIVSGDIQVGYMGMGPFITAVMKGTPYKLYTALCAQPMGLMTSDPNLNSLKDFKEGDQIALVNVGSIQHIMLAFAAKKELGDAHAMDNYITAMAHPDGMTALLSGTVKAHLTTTPYILQEAEDTNLHEITSVREAFPENAAFQVGAASNDLHDNHKDIYEGLVKATNEAIEYTNSNPEGVAKLIYDKVGVTEEKMVNYLQADGVLYTSKPIGLMEIATFMKDAGFIEKAPAAFSDITFENVEEK